MWRNDDQRSSKIEDKEERAKLNYLNHVILTLILKLTFKKIRVSVPYWRNNQVNLNHKNSLTHLNELQSDYSRKLHQPQLSPPWPQYHDDLYLQSSPINVSQRGNCKNQWKILTLIACYPGIDKCSNGIKKLLSLCRLDQLNMRKKYLLIAKISLLSKLRDIKTFWNLNENTNSKSKKKLNKRSLSSKWSKSNMMKSTKVKIYKNERLLKRSKKTGDQITFIWLKKSVKNRRRERNENVQLKGNEKCSQGKKKSKLNVF